jgi:hypothetical protein
VAAVDFKSGREASGAAGEIEKSRRFAMALHEFDALQRFDSADEDRGGDAGAFADDIEHEVRPIVEKDISMAGGEIHRTYARSWATKVMSGGITGRIRFRFHDAAAEPAFDEIVDDDFSDEKAR